MIIVTELTHTTRFIANRERIAAAGFVDIHLSVAEYFPYKFSRLAPIKITVAK